MSNQKPGMLVPALVGGLVAGLLTGIPLINCFCCLWIIGGAVLASYLLVKDSTGPLSSGDGAIVGVFTGIVAAVANTIVSIPFQPLNNKFALRIMEVVSEYVPEMPSGWEDWLNLGGGSTTLFSFMLDLIFSTVIFSALGVLGGILGIALFGKKTPLKTQDSGEQTP